MASIFAHAVCAVAVSDSLRKKQIPRRLWLLAIISAILPDIDVIGFAWGIEYGDVLGHRGFTHSLFFAALWAGLLALWLFKEERYLVFTILFFVTASHGVLDAMTNGGLGIAFLSPFDNTRYFFDFRPIQVSPIGIQAFFSEWGLRVIQSEVIWVGLPGLSVLLTSKTIRYFTTSAK